LEGSGVEGRAAKRIVDKKDGNSDPRPVQGVLEDKEAGVVGGKRRALAEGCP